MRMPTVVGYSSIFSRARTLESRDCSLLHALRPNLCICHDYDLYIDYYVIIVFVFLLVYF